MELSSHDIALRPSPGLASPSKVCFSPCGKFLTFLLPQNKDDLGTNHLFYIDVSDPKRPGDARKVFEADPATLETDENVSLAEKLRRERSRTMSCGVTSFAWGGDVLRLLVPINGNIYAKEADTIGHDNSIRLVYDKSSKYTDNHLPGGALDATISMDGNLVGFVANSELYIKSLIPGEENLSPVRLTFDARPGVTNGLADYLAQEEMDRYNGFWFSHDGSHLAFEQVDESHIPVYRIVHQGSESTTSEAYEDHHYPFSGKKNPKVRLGIISIKDALQGKVNTLWLDSALSCDEPDDTYLARVKWLPNGNLAAQLENRDQTELQLVFFDKNNGERQLIIKETSDIWINLHKLFSSFESKAGERALSLGSEHSSENGPQGFFFLWGSETSGFMHLVLYYYSYATHEAKKIRPITAGDWMVTSVVSISADDGRVIFTSTKESATERHLYVTYLWDNEGIQHENLCEPVRLSKSEGTNSAVVNHTQTLMALSVDNINSPVSFKLQSLDWNPKEKGSASVEIGAVVDHTIHDAATSPLTTQRLNQLQPFLKPPKLFTFMSRDGEELCGAVYLPNSERHGPGPYPLIVSVYGGPHAQFVRNTWSATSDMRAQGYRNAGFAVLKVDNRGSAFRGLKFEGAIKNRMGTIEVLDQEDGVSYLIKKEIADPNRVGIYGWSYGGYMSLMCMAQKPEVFHVAVSGAPVTSWDGYDTHYTERYMSTPEKNPDGYENGSVMNKIHNLRDDSKLMLVHGLIDENVHFRHTARLINSLVSAGKPYDLLLFPEERHSPRKIDGRIYMEERIDEYFRKHLMNRQNATLPANS